MARSIYMSSPVGLSSGDGCNPFIYTGNKCSDQNLRILSYSYSKCNEVNFLISTMVEHGRLEVCWTRRKNTVGLKSKQKNKIYHIVHRNYKLGTFSFTRITDFSDRHVRSISNINISSIVRCKSLRMVQPCFSWTPINMAGIPFRRTSNELRPTICNLPSDSHEETGFERDSNVTNSELKAS